MITTEIKWYTFEEKLPEPNKGVIVSLGEKDFIVGVYEAKKEYTDGKIMHCIYVVNNYLTDEVPNNAYWTYEEKLIDYDGN